MNRPGFSRNRDAMDDDELVGPVLVGPVLIGPVLNVGVAAGLAGWAITIMGGQAATGKFTVAVVLYASRFSKGTS